MLFLYRNIQVIASYFPSVGNCPFPTNFSLKSIRSPSRNSSLAFPTTPASPSSHQHSLHPLNAYLYRSILLFFRLHRFISKYFLKSCSMAFKQTTQRSISKTPKQYFPTPCEGPKKRVASCTHAFGMQRSLLTPHNVRLGDLMPYGIGESDSDDDSDVSSITGTSDSGPNDRFDCDPYCSTKTLTKLVHNVQLLASGLERFTLARTTKMEHGGDIYLGTKGACNDEFHVSACRFNPANLVITLSDHDGKGKVDDSLQAITSIRRPMSSTDDETAALYQRVLARLYGYRSFSLKAGRALCETEIFTRLSQEIFPTIRRTITIHM